MLELEAGVNGCKTDGRGRAYFGDVSVAEGSGRCGAGDENAPGNAPGSMELVLVAEVAGLGGADARWHSRRLFCLLVCSRMHCSTSREAASDDVRAEVLSAQPSVLHAAQQCKQPATIRRCS